MKTKTENLKKENKNEKLKTKNEKQQAIINNNKKNISSTSSLADALKVWISILSPEECRVSFRSLSIRIILRNSKMSLPRFFPERLILKSAQKEPVAMTSTMLMTSLQNNSLLGDTTNRINISNVNHMLAEVSIQKKAGCGLVEFFCNDQVVSFADILTV